MELLECHFVVETWTPSFPVEPLDSDAEPPTPKRPATDSEATNKDTKATNKAKTSNNKNKDTKETN